MPSGDSATASTTRGVMRVASPLSASSRNRGNGPAGVAVDTGEYHVVSVVDLSAVGPTATAQSQAEAFALRDALVRANPSLAGAVQVMASHELTMAGAA